MNFKMMIILKIKIFLSFHKNQDVTNKKEFKKWFKSAKEYVKNKNLKRSKDYIERTSYKTSILTIQFCDNCNSYTICSLDTGFSFVICNKCKECFCIGYSRRMQKLSEYRFEDTVCLRGCLKAFYLRAIYRRSDLIVTYPLFNIIHIIFCLFITPLYLGYISHFMGFIIHKNKKRIMKELNQKK